MSRWSRIADLLREAAAGVPVVAGVAAVAAELLGAERAGSALLTDGVPAGVVGTDAVAEALLAEEFLRGEGPAVGVLRTRFACTADEALGRLRDDAAATGRALVDVAAEAVRGRR